MNTKELRVNCSKMKKDSLSYHKLKYIGYYDSAYNIDKFSLKKVDVHLVCSLNFYLVKLNSS
jgi:hypothetical protein